MKGRGFATVTALFLLVVLGVIGAYLLTVAGVQGETGRHAVRGARAYQAALAGIEWALHYIAPTGGSDPSVPCGANAGTTVTRTLSLAGGALDGFTVKVTCRYTEARERSDRYRIYELESVAESGAWGNRAYVRRRVRLVVTDAR